MGKKRVLIAFVFLVVLTPLILGTQITTPVDKGIQVSYPNFDKVAQDTAFNLTIEAYNLSSGKEITDAICNLTITQSDGEILINRVKLNTLALGGYNDYLLAGNFSTLGEYSYNIYCYKGTIGGFANGLFYVTYSGKNLETSQSILYIGLFAILILIFLVNFFGIGMLPSSNTKDADGKLLSISYLKYLRGTLWFVEWILLLGIIYISSNIAFAYLGEQLIAQTLLVLYRIMFPMTLIITVIWVFWLIAKIIQDGQLRRLMERGFGGYNA